jgi:2-(1,2-epoxy-1,2-dihydrophenyl)acetyl-CoA isomerase
MSFEHIIYDVSDEIATITLNRPEARNALSVPMRGEIDHCIADIKEKAGSEIKVVVITGAGGAFCAGGDVKAMGKRDDSAAGGRRRMREAHNRLYDIQNLEVPVIAAVNGPAAGAGANLALAADFVLATPRSIFMQAFGRIGLVPDWSGFWILPRIVGLARAKELVFTARKVGAAEAKQMGMIYDVLPEENFMQEVRAFAGRFRGASTTAIALAKNVLNQSFNLDQRTVLELEAMTQAVCQGTDYHKEAVRRFAEKLPPMFDWDAFEKAAKANAKQAAE